MAASLKCHICGELILTNPYSAYPLGEHLLKQHPENNIIFYQFESKTSCRCGRNKLEKTDKECAVFKTTVETWRDGLLRIKCPNCEQEDRPYIRKQRSRVAYSKLGAFCMLACWPLCFMPFLMPEASAIDLFCKHCGHFLGEYNRKTGDITCKCDNDAVDKKFDLPYK